MPTINLIGSNIPIEISKGGTNLTTQTYFQAYQSTSKNFTCNSTTEKVIFDTAIVNVGAAYNTSTGVFTAPATGFYSFCADLYFSSVGAGTTNVLMSIKGSVNSFRVNQQVTTGGTVVCTASFNLQMTANDTIYVQPFEDGAGTFTIYGAAPSSGALSGFSMFSGYRIA
jgi:hypothetical protein